MISDSMVARIDRMENAIMAGEFSFIENTLEEVLGRKSLNLNEYVKRS